MIDKELRAYELLQWVPFSLPADCDEDLVLLGHYSKTQRARSDAALDAWEAAHPYETSAELAAFRELERLRIYTQQNFFSPSRAKDGYYTRRLRSLHQSRKPERPQGTPRARPVRRKGGPL